jgi:hypothetical protein
MFQFVCATFRIGSSPTLFASAAPQDAQTAGSLAAVSYDVEQLGDRLLS